MKLINELNLAKDNAEKTNKAKNDFLSSMSHEIRTPLNAIVGFSQDIMVEVENINPDLKTIKSETDDIIMAGQNLLEIVNGVLDISKIEANKMDVVESNYILKELLDDITKLIKPRIWEKPIEFETNYAKDSPYEVYGDKSKVKEIIINLLTNALKYTEEGEINFRVSCINTKTKSKLVISVEDTGRGNKADKIEKLFTKFNRLYEDRNTTLEGTGLGLAITKKISKEYNSNNKPKFKIDSILELDYKENEFDVSFSNGVLEHFNDEEIILTLQKQMYIAKTVIVGIPTKYFDPEEAMYGDERFMSFAFWRKIIDDAGGKIIEEKSCHYMGKIKRIFDFKKYFRPYPFRIFVIEKK